MQIPENDVRWLPFDSGGIDDSSAPIQIDRIQHRVRVIRPSKGVNIRGYQPVRKGHPLVAFESLLEKATIKALARCPASISIVAQPITIHFHVANQPYRYTPDLLVEFSSLPTQLQRLGFEARTLIECKPHDRLAAERIRMVRCFRATRLACREPLVLITELHLRAGLLEIPHDR